MGTLLFVTKYLSGDIPAIIKESHVVIVALVAVFIAMALDLVFGVRAAKKRGEARTSYGFRRSIFKFLEYYACLLIAFIIDVIASISENVNLPYITFIMALVLVGIEAYSIYENIQNKKLKSINKSDLKILIALLENRGDILKAIIESAKEKIKESDKTEIDNG